MRRVDYPNGAAWAAGAAQAIAADLARSPAPCGLALAGGGTPRPVYVQLAPLLPDGVTLFPGDERAVPPEHPRSNWRMLADVFGKDRVTMLYDPKFGQDLNAAAADAARRLAEVLPPAVAVLGMGADMHTASLFPGDADLAAALAPDAPPVVPTRRATDEPRLSLSAPCLQATRSVHLLIRGPAKARALARALAEPDATRAPVRLVLDRATVHFTEVEDD